jgi:hypothetical protein
MNQLKFYLFVALFIRSLIPSDSKQSFPGIICDKYCSNVCLKTNTKIELLEICMKNCLCKNKMNNSVSFTTVTSSNNSMKNLFILSFSLLILIMIGFNVYNYMTKKSSKVKVNLYEMLRSEDKESKLVVI